MACDLCDCVAVFGCFFAVKGNSVSRALPLQDMDNVAVLTFLLWDLESLLWK